MPLPVSTSQMLAQNNVNRLKQARTQAAQAIPTQIDYGHASNPIGLISQGLSTIGQAYHAPEQDRVNQLNLNRSEAIRQEGIAAEQAQNQQAQANKDRTFNAGQEQQQFSNSRLTAQDQIAASLRESAQQKEDGAFNKRSMLDNALATALDPFQKTQELNAATMELAMADPKINVTFNENGTPIFAGSDDASNKQAEKLFGQLQHTNTTGNSEAFKRQMNTLREASLANSNKYDDLSVADVNASVDQYVNNLTKLGALDANQAEKLKGEVLQIEAEKTAAYKQTLGTLSPDEQEQFKALDNYKAIKAEQGDTFDPTANFRKRVYANLDSGSDKSFVDEQITDAYKAAASSYNEDKTSTGEWDDGYAKLAYQRALEETTIRTGFWELGDNEINEGKLESAIKAEMNKINSSKEAWEVKERIDNDFNNKRKAAELKAQAKAGRITK